MIGKNMEQNQLQVKEHQLNCLEEEGSIGELMVLVSQGFQGK